ncbi:ribosome-binding protein 1-like isoform X2 [Pieris brassicae]|uniref:ribosome-binding protein 1-like isoform X2 n=1 Tax=Pieris brassicae TaxID=7116 RepID=UPI001E66292E|nr:ribosome-binding protein 1-like isoform X2 [Pieris brassicae]
MSTTVKSHKDKPHTAAPRLAPRPTAASAARAAKNATNRNLTAPSTRLSPVRSPPSPTSSRVRTAIPKSGKTDSKTDIKVNRNREPENAPTVVQDIHEIVYEVAEINVVKEKNIPVVAFAEIHQNDIEDTTAVEDTMLQDDVQPAVIIETIDETQPQTPINSRPQTPLVSRPQTPKARPVTPRMSSRPSTPSQQRTNTPCSRPNTPQKATPRPKTPLKTTRPVTPTNEPRISNDSDIKSVYAAKQKQFHRLKKELDLKQQAVLEVFENLRSLHERLLNEGHLASGEGAPELVLCNVADWTEEEIHELCRQSTADGAVEVFNNSIPIDENFLTNAEYKAMNIPSCFAELCLQAFAARQELIDWVKRYIEKEEEPESDALDRIDAYNKRGLEMCEALRDLKARADDAVETITLLSKRACSERATLISVGESLIREVARLRQDMETRVTVINEVREPPADEETKKVLAETRRELEDEQAAKTAMKDKLVASEAQVRQQRMRISKMDRQLREAEASITALTSTVKSLEDQGRQREVQLEARARKWRDSVKTGEVTNTHLVQQRDALEAEVADLKDQMKSLTAQHKSSVQDLNNQLKELNLALEAERETTQREVGFKDALQEELNESRNTIEELQTKIDEYERNKPNPDLPTEREMDLWAELQATKDTLRMTEDEVIACKREKVRFLETMTKIADTENEMALQQKLAAELLSKEEIIGKMQTQLRDLTKNIKLHEQKVVQYEKYVRDLQAHNRALINSQDTSGGICYPELQQETMTLKMSLLDAVHRNEELSEMLAQKEQQLEQQDKTARTQIREELINVLKNKEMEQTRELSALQQDLDHRMKIVDGVNKQIAAKADEIQELFATLETKQQQIHRLEKIVLALEDQQRRAQVQRTRHETKIAALEHELAAGGNRKDRKFIFF